MARADKHGHAVYLEFRDTNSSGRVAQFIIIGFTASAMEAVPFRMLSRTVTEANPQPKYRHDWNPAGIPQQVKAVSGSLQRLARPEGGFILAREAWDYLVGTLDVIALGQWQLVDRPLVVQVSQLDIQSLKNNARPKLLLDRINRVRLAAGFPTLPSKARS